MSRSGPDRHAAAELGTALRSQLGLMRRTHAVALVALVAVIALGAGGLTHFWPERGMGRLSVAQLLASMHGLLQVVALFWGAMVTWRGEGPGERFLHWTQPIDRVRNQLARTVAGGAWLLLAVVIGGTLAWVAGAVLQGGMAVGPVRVPLASVGSLALLYLLGSIPALLSDRPAWWIIGVYVGYGLLTAVANVAGWPIVEPLQAVFGFEGWGLARAASAPTVLGVESVLPAATDGSSPWAPLGAWLAVASAAAAAAASVHQDRSGSG